MERGAKTKQSIEKIIIIWLMLKFFFCSFMEKFKTRSCYFLYESSSVRESFFRGKCFHQFASAEWARIKSLWNFHTYNVPFYYFVNWKVFSCYPARLPTLMMIKEREKLRASAETACEEMWLLSQADLLRKISHWSWIDDSKFTMSFHPRQFTRFSFWLTSRIICIIILIIVNVNSIFFFHFRIAFSNFIFFLFVLRNRLEEIERNYVMLRMHYWKAYCIKNGFLKSFNSIQFRFLNLSRKLFFFSLYFHDISLNHRQ